MFLPKRKLFTAKEYKEEGAHETAAALQELRDFGRQNTGEMYSMFTRLDELQEENKRLREEVATAKEEAAKMKKLIIGKLSTTT